MDLTYTTEQAMLRKSAAEFISKECPFDSVKEIEESEEGYSASTWKKMAKLGWMELYFPEKYGGLGDPFVNITILMEEMGKRAFPSPFFSTVIMGGLILLEGGSEEQKKKLIPKLISGSLILALAHHEEDAGYSPSSISARAVSFENGYRLIGSKLFAMDANIAVFLIVSALTDEGISLFLVDSAKQGIECRKMPTIGKDNTCAVTFKDVHLTKDDMIGRPGDGWLILEKVMPRAILAKCAEMLGGCETALKMAITYAKQRVQYGVPIGGFQVIQHYLADMKTAFDTTLYYYHRVAWMIEEGLECTREISALKARVNKVYKHVTDRSIQIHGGIGTTREFNVGLFYRRAKSSESMLGDSEYHYERIAEQLGL